MLNELVGPLIHEIKSSWHSRDGDLESKLGVKIFSDYFPTLSCLNTDSVAQNPSQIAN